MTTRRLLDDVWCRTCQHIHVATIPVVTFRCAGGPDHGCGYGGWWVTEAAQHASDYPDHIVYPKHHETVPFWGREDVP